MLSALGGLQLLYRRIGRPKGIGEPTDSWSEPPNLIVTVFAKPKDHIIGLRAGNSIGSSPIISLSRELAIARPFGASASVIDLVIAAPHPKTEVYAP
jgi:hypothetical protein